jgi:hypothetical protein
LNIQDFTKGKRVLQNIFFATNFLLQKGFKKTELSLIGSIKMLAGVLQTFGLVMKKLAFL